MPSRHRGWSLSYSPDWARDEALKFIRKAIEWVDRVWLSVIEKIDEDTVTEDDLWDFVEATKGQSPGWHELLQEAPWMTRAWRDIIPLVRSWHPLVDAFLDDVGDHNVGALCGQGQRQFLAYAGAASGNDGRLAAKGLHGCDLPYYGHIDYN